MMTIVLSICKWILNLIYSLLKIFKTKKNRIIFISRQSNKMTLDFKMIIDNINKKNKDIEVLVFCKRFDDIKKHIISYFFYTLKVMYYLATSKVCVIDSYCLPVSVLKHKKSLKVIQIWHSLGAIKKFGYQTLGTKYGRKRSVAKALNMHKNYDIIISGSKEMSKYFSMAFHYDIKYFKNYGLPRIDYIMKNKKNIQSKIFAKYPKLKDKPIILYAPTFRPDYTSNIYDVISTVDSDKYNLIIKSHPNQKLEFKNENIYSCNNFSSLDLLCVTDYLITDYSAIAIEACAIDIKTFYFVFDYDEYQKNNGLNIDLYKEMPGCVFNDFKLLYKKLNNNDYNKKTLKKYQEKYLDNKKGNSTELIVKEIINNMMDGEHDEKN